MSSRYKITVVPFAVDGSNGTQWFNESVDSLCDTLQPRSLHNDLWNHPNKQAGYSVIVATVRLSQFILAHTKPEDRIVIKLDAEGAEYGIIHDLLNSPSALARVKEMLIEWHYVAADTQKERLLEASLMQRLRDAGCDAKIWNF